MIDLYVPSFVAAWIASDHARDLADDLESTRIRLRWTRKEMASRLGLTEQQLSNQLTLKEPLNIYRLADLPLHSFWAVFLVVRAKRTGQQVFEDARMDVLVSSVQALVRKRMARMTCVSTDEQKERVG